MSKKKLGGANVGKVFRLKRIKTVGTDTGIQVILYGHAARGREQRLGSFMTTSATIKDDLQLYLEKSDKIEKSTLNL